VFSFHPVKIITTAEGGLITTHDTRLAATLRLLRSHGITRDPKEMTGVAPGAWYYEQVALGFNYRMTDVQAALGTSQLTRLAESYQRRSELAERYDELLARLPLTLPARIADRESAWHLYVVELDPVRSAVTRASAFTRLRSSGIGVNVHYIPIHLQPYYREHGFKRGQFPNAEHYYEHALTLPLFAHMTYEQQDEVVAALSDALAA
jgi:dTDP-4-amino-4,6-dideoxygalactose transaminase